MITIYVYIYIYIFVEKLSAGWITNSRGAKQFMTLAIFYIDS